MDSEPAEDLTCPWCDARMRRGALVCRGCHAEVAYGVTRREIKVSVSFGLIVGVGAALLVIFKTDVSNRFGENGLFGILFGLPLGAAVIFTILSWRRGSRRP